MLYIISYYYYDRSDDMPYRKVDIDPDISYELASDKIIFILDPVRLLPSKQKFKIIPTYTLYISNSSNTTTMNSKCDLNVGFSQSQTASSDNEDVIKFPIDVTFCLILSIRHWLSKSEKTATFTLYQRRLRLDLRERILLLDTLLTLILRMSSCN
jgi:hypothetical protein